MHPTDDPDALAGNRVHGHNRWPKELPREWRRTLLDYFDAHDLWRDTALVLTTDHGFLLAEHDWWGKCRMPFYNEVAHIPLMIHTPATGAHAGRRCASLTQTIEQAQHVDFLPRLQLHPRQDGQPRAARRLLRQLQRDAGLHRRLGARDHGQRRPVDRRGPCRRDLLS